MLPISRDTKAQCHAILIVEDDRAISDILREFLEAEGYPVLTAKNGKEALTILNSLECTDPPCLILLDLFMPVMDGWEFLKHLSENRVDFITTIPIVIVSAAGARADDIAKQVNGFIKKPIDLDLLLLAVEKYCGLGR